MNDLNAHAFSPYVKNNASVVAVVVAAADSVPRSDFDANLMIVFLEPDNLVVQDEDS